MTTHIRLTELEKALTSLEKAAHQSLTAGYEDFIRDACIQRFEFTFELTWKTAKKLLEKLGIQSSSPRSVIRDMGQQNWISDLDLWMKFLDDRNLTSHTYKEDIANQVYSTAKLFAVECKKLLTRFKSI